MESGMLFQEPGSERPSKNLLLPRKAVRGNRDVCPDGNVSATSPPLGGASECSQAGLRACRLGPTSQTSRTSGPVSIGVRTCLPLRGSSGLSPDSLFTLGGETQELDYCIS